jgi:hypothetical protein
MYSRLPATAVPPALFHGPEDHDGDVYQPFVSGFNNPRRPLSYTWTLKHEVNFSINLYWNVL